MAILYAVGGEPIQIDDEDRDRLSVHDWKVRHGYAWTVVKHPVTGKNRLQIPMHRMVMGLEFGDPREVDHRFHDGLDNRKSELRVCSGSENQYNRRLNRNSSSGFKGVSWHKQHGRWRAHITINGKYRQLGMFDTAEEANEFRMLAAEMLHGSFVCHR